MERSIVCCNLVMSTCWRTGRELVCQSVWSNQAWWMAWVLFAQYFIVCTLRGGGSFLHYPQWCWSGQQSSAGERNVVQYLITFKLQFIKIVYTAHGHMRIHTVMCILSQFFLFVGCFGALSGAGHDVVSRVCSGASPAHGTCTCGDRGSSEAIAWSGEWRPCITHSRWEWQAWILVHGVNIRSSGRSLEVINKWSARRSTFIHNW